MSTRSNISRRRAQPKTKDYIKQTYTYPDDPHNGYNPWSETSLQTRQQQRLDLEKEQKEEEERKQKEEDERKQKEEEAAAAADQGGIMAWISRASTPLSKVEEKAGIMSWVTRASTSTQAQFVATAVVSGVVVAGAILGYQSAQRTQRVERLKKGIPEEGWGDSSQLSNFGATNGTSKEDKKSAELAIRAQKGDYDDELILEQLARNRVFLTDEGLSKLRSSFVVVVGCGGVGSHCVAALARSGVTYIRLVDFDQVTLSSLNRHSVATLADVGTPKVTCLKKRLQQIAPWVHFDLCNEMFDAAVAGKLLAPWKNRRGRKPDYVIDAIDNIDSKVALLEYCYKHKLPVISSMGAGCKSDPTRIFIGDISSSTEDPLSRSTRRRLRALGISSGIPVVYSTEKPGPGKAQLMPLPEEEIQKGSVSDLGVMPDFRVRILPVLGTMPAVFGYAVANHVILNLTGYPNEYIPAKGRDKMYDGILAQLQGTEEKLVRQLYPGEDAKGLKLPLSVDDVGYLIEEVYRGRSVVSGISTRLALVRWRRPEGEVVNLGLAGQKSSILRLRDLVCMTKEEAAKHDKEIVRGKKKPEDIYTKRVLKMVELRMKEEMDFEKYR